MKPTSITITEKLQKVLQGDLDFHSYRSSYSSHNLHAFAAKFPPQLPEVFIKELTEPYQIVLDPMMGSGTTLVEAMRLNRSAIGIDIDPLACLLCRVKTTPLDLLEVKSAAYRLIKDALNFLADIPYLEDTRQKRFDEDTLAFMDYWFRRSTQDELTALLLAIEKEPNIYIRDFFKLVFSSTIITKSGGVSLARDLAHSRPHLDRQKEPRNAVRQMEKLLDKAMGAVVTLPSYKTQIQILEGDARDLALPVNSVHLILTSPPYANAIDYMRAHKFSLVWFNYKTTELTERRAIYIGSERKANLSEDHLPGTVLSIVRELKAIDAHKASVLLKYFRDMGLVLEEMLRVLRPGCAAIIVVGSSIMRSINIQTHRCIADIAVSKGFKLIGIAERKLDRNRRMLPASFSPTRQESMIEQRMHNEYVIGLIKPG